MRTKLEIDEEIAALEACKKYVPKMTAFGENNHVKIDLQIELLRGELDTTAMEFEEEFDDGEKDAIFDAERWLDGGTAPSSDWDGFKLKAL